MPVFYIQTGTVKITVLSEQGKEAVVAILTQDTFCGEGCLTGQLLRMATATAMTECEIMRVEKAAMICVLREGPGLLRCSSRIFWLGPSERRRTLLISYSIRARNA